MEDKQISCRNENCQMKFKTYSGRYKHEKTKCKKGARQVKVVLDFVETETAKFQCKICNKVIAQKQNMYRHLKQHKIIKPKSIKKKQIHTCPVCSKTFPKLSKLNRHIPVHDNKYTCMNCHTDYKRIDHFLSHSAVCKESFSDVSESFCLGDEFENEDEGLDYMDEGTSTILEDDDNSSISSKDDDNSSISSKDIDFTREGKSKDVNVVTSDQEVEKEHPSCYNSSTNSESIKPMNEDVDVVGDSSVEVTASCSRRDYNKKRDNLILVLNRLKTATKTEQSKIIRKSFEITNTDLTEVAITKTNKEKEFEAKITGGILNFLKIHSLQTKENKHLFFSLVSSICGDELSNPDFFSWFCGKINKRPGRIQSLLDDFHSGCIELRGRKQLSLEVQQTIFDVWHNNSIVTCDRRNGRDQKTVRKNEYDKYKKLKVPNDVLIEEFTTERSQQMMRSTRRIHTKTINQIHQEAQSKVGCNISKGSVMNLKPFYIEKPTDREKESCLCNFCFNLRLRYTALCKHIKNRNIIEESMSNYFANGITCDKDKNVFFQLKCISSECDNCSMNCLYTIDDFEVSNSIKYDQFVRTKYTYISKNNEKKIGQRTIRTEYVEPLADCLNFFNAKGSSYLLHRYEIFNDKFVWPQIISDAELGYSFHLDFSENITATPKYEPQDAHFSGKQTTLHCSVIHNPSSDKPTFVYHISDNKNHDAVFVDVVIRDLINKFNVNAYPVLRIKSDNCSTQYCCRFNFELHQKLSFELKKTLIIYYGVNGHGKGLVDAMSGFGVKTPLRRAIVTDDYIFNSGEELTRWLQLLFKNDQTKIYDLITEDNLINRRKERGDGIPIKGCRRSRMIAFFPDKSIKIKRHICYCDSCKLGLFDKCLVGNVDSNLDDELIALDDTDNLAPEQFVLIEEDSYVAVYSNKNSFELFYIIKVVKKCVAESDICDIYGHIIQKGSEYCEGYYLEKVLEKGAYVHYKLVKKLVYFHPAEVLCPSVPICDNLKLSVDVYLSLAENI